MVLLGVGRLIWSLARLSVNPTMLGARVVEVVWVEMGNSLVF